MLFTAILLALLPALAKCTGEGNIRLLQEEVAAALKTCTESDSTNPQGQRQKRFADKDILMHDEVKSVTDWQAQRQKRFADNEPRINNGTKPKTNTHAQRQKRFANNEPRIDYSTKPETNPYSHERRNVTDMKDQIFVINVTDSDYDGYGNGNMGEKFINSSFADVNGTNRTRRSEPLINKLDNEQCLSQCVFANLQVVDSRGIPREAELWNKVQSFVTSQQSRAALRDQISACFQELQSEAEDNGCSYSNKLERCLMLRFSDRKPSSAQNNKGQRTKPTA